MFETVAPEKFAPRSRKIFYETLPLSIAVHALFGAAVLGIGLWEVVFPEHTPRLIAMYSLESVPTPPPPPPPPAAAPKQVAVQPQQAASRLEELAPTVIPEIIPLVLPQLPQPLEELPIASGVTGGIEGGIEGGVAGGMLEGVEGGEVGGQIGGEVGSVAAPDTVVVKRDMPLPTSPMSMVFPKYPEEARVRGWEDVLVVRYIIGKNGRVRDVTVLTHPERDMFEKVTLKAIRSWRFRPHKKDGVPQEVVHELTIFFKLT